jgi:peptidoglycan/LPS O-acetylase OafA/YrhL
VTSALKKEIPGIHGLRAIACLAVFGVHLEQYTGIGGSWGPFDLALLLRNGNVAVCFFFMLTGALLSLPVWRNTTQHPLAPSTAWSYFMKRFRRIAPAYYMCLAVLVLIRSPWKNSQVLPDAGAHFLFVHNYTEAYFYSFAAPFWFIAIQMQFYLVLPFLLELILAIPFGLRGRIVFAILMAFVAYGTHFMLMTGAFPGPLGDDFVGWAQQHPLCSSHSVLAHLPHLALGIAVGGVLSLDSRRASTHLPSTSYDFLVGVVFLAILAILSTPLQNYLVLPYARYYFPVIPVLIGFVILFAPRGNWILRILEWRPIRYLGIISFGVYVYHYPVMSGWSKLFGIAGISLGTQWVFFALVSWATSIVVAAVSYEIIEKRFHF